MKRTLIGLSITLLTSTVFGASLETLRTARSALGSRANLSIDDANTLHRLGTKILEIEKNLLQRQKIERTSDNPLLMKVKKARKAVDSFINNTDPENRTEGSIDTLNKLIAERASAENALIDALRSEGF